MRSIPSTASVLILSAALTACGGSGGSSDDPAPVDPTDPTTPTNPVDPTDPTTPTDPTDPPVSTGSRMSAINYDLDNNGTIDATATILYDTNGRPSDFMYVYTGDSAPDTAEGIIGLRGNTDESLSFSYDSNGKLEQQIQDIPSASTITRLVFNFEWDANELVTRNVNDFFDASGGLFSRNSTDITYNGNLVSGWNEVQENISPAAITNATGTVTYDGDNQPTDITYDVGGVVSFNKTLTWDQGRTATSETTANSGTDTITYTYSADGQRLETRTITDGTNTQVHTFVYDSNNRLSEIRYDRENDGVIDAVETPVWEDGACENILNWFGFSAETPFLSTASSPYLNGSGYGLINFCENSGHVQ